MSNTTIKIGYDAKRLFHNRTGLGNYSRTLVKELHQRFPQIEFHLFSATTKRDSETEYFFNHNNIHIHTCDSGSGLWWRSFKITHKVNDLGLDIYHGLSHELPLNLSKMKAKTVVSFHDLIYEKYPEQFPWFDCMMYKFKYRTSVQSADQIVAISQSTKSDLTNIYKVDEAIIKVIYQGQSLSDASNTTPANLPERYWLYVGSVIERKRLEDVVMALHQMPPEDRLPVIVIGTGSTYYKKVKELIQHYDLSDYFIHKGHVRESLAHVYKHALALVYPSIYEGFGIPVIEALSQNTPVIISDHQALGEAAGPGALKFESYNSEQLSATMLRLQNNKNLAEDLATRGKSYIVNSFNHDLICSQWMDLYSNLIR